MGCANSKSSEIVENRAPQDAPKDVDATPVPERVQIVEPTNKIVVHAPPRRGIVWKLIPGADCWTKKMIKLEKNVLFYTDDDKDDANIIQMSNYCMRPFRIDNSDSESKEESSGADTTVECPFKSNKLLNVFRRKALKYDENVENDIKNEDSSHHYIFNRLFSEHSGKRIMPTQCDFMVLLYISQDKRANKDLIPCICLLLESEKEWTSWLTAFKAHMPHNKSYDESILDCKPLSVTAKSMKIPTRKNEKEHKGNESSDSSATLPANQYTKPGVVKFDGPIPKLLRGFGRKEGRGAIKSLTDRYFVLEDGVLHYYEKPMEHYPYGYEKKGEIQLATFSISTRDDAMSIGALMFESEELKENFVISFEDSESLDPEMLGVKGCEPVNSRIWKAYINAHIDYVTSYHYTVRLKREKDGVDATPILSTDIPKTASPAIEEPPTNTATATPLVPDTTPAVAPADASQNPFDSDDETPTASITPVPEMVPENAIVPAGGNPFGDDEDASPPATSQTVAAVVSPPAPVAVQSTVNEPTRKSHSLREQDQTPIIVRGLGRKQGRHFIKSIKERQFVLEEGVLNYYVHAIDIYPFGREKKGEIPLSSFTVSLTQSDKLGAGVSFVSKELEEQFVIHFDNAIGYVGDAQVQIDCNDWCRYINKHIKYAKSQEDMF